MGFAGIALARGTGFTAVGIVAVAVIVVRVALAVAIGAALTGEASGIAVTTMGNVGCRIDASPIAIGEWCTLKLAS